MKKKIVLLPLFCFLFASCTNNPDPSPKKYSITFKDEAGNVLNTQEVLEGQLPSFEYEPLDTEEYDYTFLGWSLSQDGEQLESLPVANADAVYFAVVSKIKVFLAELLEKVNNALNELETTILEFVGIEDTDPLRIEFNQFCTNEINKALGVNTKAEADSIFLTIKADINSYLDALLVKLVDALKIEINNFFDERYSNYDNGSLKTAIYAAKDTLIETLDEIDSLNDLKNIKSSFKQNVENHVQELIADEIALAKQIVKTALDSKVESLLALLPSDSLKNELTAFYKKEMELIENTTRPDQLSALVEQIKEDVLDELDVIEEKAISYLVEEGTKKLNEVIDPILNMIPDGELKNDIKTEYNSSIAAFNEVDSLETAKAAIDKIVDDTLEFTKEEIAKVYGALKSSLEELVKIAIKDLNISIADYLPESMCPGYDNNLVSSDDVNYDLENNFVDVADIKIGFGEQWNSVLDTIDIFEQFLGIVNKGSVITNGVTGLLSMINDDFNVSTHLEYKNEFIKFATSFDDDLFELKGNFLKGIDIPKIGNVKPELIICNDILNNIRTVKVKITDKNVVKYEISEDKLQIAVSYGVELLFKQTMLLIEDNGEQIVGNIIDHTAGSLKDKNIQFDCLCDFYVGNNYVSVVGNKADGIFGMDGYINELYDKSTGKLLGYKIQETKTILNLEGTYHTLWFNLKDITGINNIKVTNLSDKHKSESPKSTFDVYLNNSNSLMGVKYNKELFIETSRYYDIELRNQYFYSYNSETEECEKLTVKTPMMFIQDDNNKDHNFTDTPTEFKKLNNFDISVSMSSFILEQIRSDYDNLIPLYKEEVKEMKTSNAIQDWLDA